MRFFKLISAAAAIALLCACAEVPDSISDTSSAISEVIRQNESIQPQFSEHEGHEPLNFTEQIGIWYPYMDYADYMQGKSAEEFRSSVREKFTQAQAQSINTVYVHIHPCGDAYYNSEIFPRGAYLDGDYDPLQIMIEEAHELGLSVHGWINPLRCQTVEQMKALPDDFIVKQWAETRMGSTVNIVGDRYYLNPAYDEVIDLICREIDEIVRNYNVDGIHIDDYFYPTTSPDFDRSAFEVSGSTDLSAWRLENCSRLVHAMYESVKRADSDILFGISPQGNINADYSSQYADVRLWCSCAGYCDYIIPQIYFGFENETCPFSETLAQWEDIVTREEISLIIGLAAYKLGSEDKWAGAAGELEWIEDPDIITKQIEAVANSSADGYALYY